MAFGTIAIDTLSTSGQISGTAVSVDADYLAHGSAKVWIKFDMSGTFAIEDSFNVASLDDDGTGDFGINFTNSMGNVTYAAPASAGEDNANVLTNFGDVATTGMDGQTRQTQANAASDKLNNSVSILGDLA